MKKEVIKKIIEMIDEGYELNVECSFRLPEEIEQEINNMLKENDISIKSENIFEIYVEYIRTNILDKESIKNSIGNNEIIRHNVNRQACVSDMMEYIGDNIQITMDYKNNKRIITGISEDALGHYHETVIEYLQPRVNATRDLNILPTLIRRDKKLRKLLNDEYDKVNTIEVKSKIDLPFFIENIDGIYNTIVDSKIKQTIPKELVYNGPTFKNVCKDTNKSPVSLIPDLDVIHGMAYKLINSKGIFITEVKDEKQVILDYELMMQSDIGVNHFDIITGILKEAVERLVVKIGKPKLSIVDLNKTIDEVYKEYLDNMHIVSIY